MRFALLFLLLISIQAQSIDSLNKKKQVRPDNLNIEQSVLSDSEKLIVAYKTVLNPVPLNKIHGWEVSVTEKDGSPINNAVVNIYAGMPEHLHGMTTKAQVTHSGSQGKYLINGMNFHMPGWWEIIIEVSRNGVTDAAYFNLIIGEDMISNDHGHHHHEK